MHIIYRVYKKHDFYYNNEIIAQDVIEVNKKEDFKEAIKLIYGDDIKFKNNKNVQTGDLFISIISYDCQNPNDYLITKNCRCSKCGKSFIANNRNLIAMSNYHINQLKNINLNLYEQFKEEIESKLFCSELCEETSYLEYNKLFKDDSINKDGFVNE